MGKKLKKLLKIIEKEKKKNKKLKKKLQRQEAKNKPLSVESVNISPQPDFFCSSKAISSAGQSEGTTESSTIIGPIEIFMENTELPENLQETFCIEPEDKEESPEDKIEEPKESEKNSSQVTQKQPDAPQDNQEKTAKENAKHKPKSLDKALCFSANSTKYSFQKTPPPSLFIPELEKLVEEKNNKPESNVQQPAEPQIVSDELTNEAIAYTDGSHNPNKEKPSYGIVFFNKGKKQTECGKVALLKDEKVSSQSAETYAVIRAIDMAIQAGCQKITIYFDCIQLMQWIYNPGKKNRRAQWYSQNICKRAAKINITMKKVKAHSGDICNNEADYLAKSVFKS